MLYMHMSLYDMCTSCIQYISYVLCKLFNQSLFLQYLNVGSPGGSPEREQWTVRRAAPRGDEGESRKAEQWAVRSRGVAAGISPQTGLWRAVGNSIQLRGGEMAISFT